MDKENTRFSTLWEVDTTSGRAKEVAADITSVRYESCPQNAPYAWNTRTDFNFLSLDDIVLSEFARPFASRFWRYLVTFWDYILSGTGFKFIKHSWRFSIYFFYPATMLFIASLLSLWLGITLAQSNLGYPVLASFIGFFVCFAAIIRLIGKRYHVLHLMDLWSFSRDFLHNDQAEIGPKLDRFASQIRQSIGSGDYDEVLLVGHSTGGALILDAAGRAYEQDPHFADSDCNVCIMTIGSTALKVGLHPSAQWFRNRLQRLFSKTSLRWVEYQCLTDIINFHRTNPAELMGLNDTLNHPPKILDIRIKQMVSPATYKRIKRNFFRVHYQFVFGNTEFHHYDFQAICLGPVGLWQRANHHQDYYKSFQATPVTVPDPNGMNV